MSLKITIINEPATSLSISLAGALNTDTAPQLQNQIDGALTAETETVVLDMKDLEFLSSAGLRVIFKTKKTLSSRNGRLLLVNVQAPVRKVFDIVKVAGSMNLFRDEKEMDRYLTTIQEKVKAERTATP